jgi:large subunit ribosomal protein L5
LEADPFSASASAKQLKRMDKKAQKLKKKSTGLTETEQEKDESFLHFLDPPPPTHDEVANRCNAYERIPRLTEVTIRMFMQDAVTHSRRVLFYGLLALQLVTGQQGSIELAKEAMSQRKVRKGMPIGVRVTMQHPAYFYGFVDKLVHVVMPKLRDFQGFSQCAGEDGSGRYVSVKLDAEAWQAFPEMEQSYLHFPQMGSVGSLQSFEIRFGTTARSDEEARLLLSGFRVPITKKEFKNVDLEVEQATGQENVVHDV